MSGRADFKKHNRIVVKVGTTSLTYENGKLNLKRIAKLAWVLTDLRNQGKEVILVSSGAIAVGTDRLGLSQRPRDIRGKQAASAVGQAVLMQIYENFFMEYNQKVAQILLTKDVFDNDTRKENARNTFSALLEMGVIPVVNENDTVSIEEIEFSDNDTLSAYVACLIEADLLIILSDIDGIYDCDPKTNKKAKLISRIDKFDDEIFCVAGESANALGTGGMLTKLYAAKMASDAHIDTVVAQGEEPKIIFKILNGDEKGTLIAGNGSKPSRNEEGVYGL